MHYPFWYVPVLTSPMLIAVVGILHMFVAMYAVGGGIFLALEAGWAYRTGNAPYLAYLRRHAGFFVVLTMVWGSITGVGIWWTIGLASPLATEFLIRTFVFAWAIEYVFFLIEIVSAFVLWYGWDRLDPGRHLAVFRIYAAAAWISLLIITPITSFMLVPGDWQGNFWRGMLNPQAAPQVLLRTGGSLLLATLYVYLHAAFAAGEGVREIVVQRVSRLAAAGVACFVAGAGWWFAILPAAPRAAVIGAPVMNIFAGIVLSVTGAVAVMSVAGLRRYPGWFGPGFAILLFGMGLGAVGAAEFVREGIRKPFVITGLVWSHNVLAAEIPGLRKSGFIAGSAWARRGAGDGSAIAADAGRALFLHHCGSCHAETGYMGMREILPGWTPENIAALVRNPQSFRYTMPPWSGTPAEAEALSTFLGTLVSPHPVVESARLAAPSPPAAPAPRKGARRGR